MNDSDRYEFEITRALWDAEQELLRQDEGYHEWLDSLESIAVYERELNEPQEPLKTFPA